ncbi:MAG: hypothetical protein J3K34DRAFT_473301 [Monoraphidium minutum]|nr:MAG: hypothetical protein J3K34DRAFT_473301 [Monoraphidium minutum]
MVARSIARVAVMAEMAGAAGVEPAPFQVTPSPVPGCKLLVAVHPAGGVWAWTKGLGDDPYNAVFEQFMVQKIWPVAERLSARLAELAEAARAAPAAARGGGGAAAGGRSGRGRDVLCALDGAWRAEDKAAKFE